MSSTTPPADAYLDGAASERMEKGIALLGVGTAPALREAIGLFEEAIALRQKLRAAETAGARYGLAAGWINRGDAFGRLRDAESLAAAVQSYETAIGILGDPPPDEDGCYSERLAIAWMNRGLARQEQGSESAWTEAVRCHREAIRVLRGRPPALWNRLAPILATACVNFGNASLRLPREGLAAEICDAAEEAIGLLGSLEAADASAAAVGLEARRVQCQALADALDQDALDSEAQASLIARMTDTLENALELAQTWEQAGLARFRPLAGEFFHLGTLVYEKHQCQFLPEFVLEYLDESSPHRHASATDEWFAWAEGALFRLRRKLRTGDFSWLATPEGRRRMAILDEARAAEERLQALRQAIFRE